jgi:uncharacterized protein DUF4136
VKIRFGDAGMNVTKAAVWCLVWFAIVSTGCQSAQVQSYSDPRFDPLAINSYAWLPNGSVALGVVPQNKAVLEQTLWQSIDENLAKRGWQQLDPGAADVLVRYVVGAEGRTKVTKTGVGQFAGRDVELPMEVRRMRSGKLAIDLIDAETGLVVWRGVTGVTRQGVPTYDEIRTSVARGVNAIFQKLPNH